MVFGIALFYPSSYPASGGSKFLTRSTVTPIILINQRSQRGGNMLGQIASAAVATVISFGLLQTTQAQQQIKGRVLVVLSSAQELELRKGKTYSTGVFFNEFVTPVRAVIAAGYEPVFANSDGSPIHFDPHSLVPEYFGGSQTKLEEAKRFVRSLSGPKHPRTFASIRAEGMTEFVGVLVPGGHAPVQDMTTNSDVGAILSAFHSVSKPTALICHGPASLLSTLPDPVAFKQAMTNGDAAAAQKLAANWPYAGYHMTAFSTSEERFAEPRLLHGQVQFYLAEALAQAGGRVEAGPDRRSATVQDRELITGQQPFSDEEFSKAVVTALDRSLVRN
jgi:putative intracellular protease/amidase